MLFYFLKLEEVFYKCDSYFPQNFYQQEFQIEELRKGCNT